jgi:dolichol kinase
MNHLGRKLFHLLGGLGLLLIYFVVDRSAAFSIYGALAVLVLAVEFARLRIPAWNRFFYEHLGSFIRKSEERKLSGTVPYILGAGLSLYLYDAETAAAAICFLAFGDVAATTIGERYGKTKIRDKSLEGTIAFALAALAGGFLLFPFGLGLAPWVLVFGALVAAGTELLPIPVNDNFSIPVVAGAAMELSLGLVRHGL